MINTHFHQRRLTLISVLHLFLIFRTRKRQRVRPESDYALKNVIEIWPIRTKGAKTSLSSLVKFQFLIFNLNLQCIIWFRPKTKNCVILIPQMYSNWSQLIVQLIGVTLFIPSLFSSIRLHFRFERQNRSLDQIDEYQVSILITWSVLPLKMSVECQHEKAVLGCFFMLTLNMYTTWHNYM